MPNPNLPSPSKSETVSPKEMVANFFKSIGPTAIVERSTKLIESAGNFLLSLSPFSLGSNGTNLDSGPNKPPTQE